MSSKLSKINFLTVPGSHEPSPRSGRITITEHHRDYWHDFYAGRASSDVPDRPSDFARWVEAQLPPEHEVVELGFGTARDSFFFSRRGRAVLGLDFAESAVDHARSQAAALALGARFDVLDLYDDAEVDRVASALTPAGGGRAVYARFLVHSLEEPGRANLLRLAAAAAGDGDGELFLEFRTGKDLGQEHLFGDDHYRVFLDPLVVELEIEALGGEITYREEGCGLAVYRSEDPHVCRLVARFPPAGTGRPS